MAAIEYIILAFLVMLSGFFSGVETAFISLGRVRLRQMIEQGKKNAELIARLKDDPHRLISTLLIGNNIVNIAASAIATSIAINIFANYGVAIATGAMTFLVLVFGEITPKTIAMSNADKICSFAAPFIEFLSRILKPIIWFLDIITRNLTRLFGEDQHKPLITEEEIKSYINIGEEIGSIEKDEKEMINNIFRMNDTEAREIMIPKVNLVMVDADKKIRDVLNKIIRSGHSRIPVYKRDKDKIVGILYIKDLMAEISSGKFNEKIGKIMKPAHFVPDTKKADSLLQEMQKLKTHIALVVNEYGEVTGIVTLEDVIEEIVGEIYDETDTIKVMIRKKDKKNYEIDGDTTLEHIYKKLGIRIKNSKEFNTISGYIMDKISRIPKNRETIHFKNFTIKILSVKQNRIEKILLTLK